MKKASYYMARALMQAELSLAKKEVPIGAVVVDNGGKIVGRGHNLMETKGCQTAHAESRAIQAACSKRGDWRLDDCVIFVTLEPCLMCYGLIHLSRITKIYLAAESPLFGFSSVIKAPDNRSIYAREIEIIKGLNQHESVVMLRSFFRGARDRRKGLYETTSKGS